MQPMTAVYYPVKPHSLLNIELKNPEVVTSLLNNSASWIGLTDEIIDILQEFQNKFMLRFFEAPKHGTPSGIVELDSNMLLMKNRIVLSKLHI